MRNTIFLISFFTSVFSFAQKSAIPDKVVMLESGWYLFLDTLHPDSFFLSLKCEPELTFRLEKIDYDVMNNAHHTYYQYYNNIRIEGAIIKLHYENTFLKYASGFYEDKMLIDTVDSNCIYPQSLQVLLNSYITISNNPQKIIIHGKRFNDQNFHLCDIYYLTSADSLEGFKLYIDNKDKNKYFIESSSENCNAIGSVNTYYHGTRSFNTSCCINNKYYLYDDSRGLGITTKYKNNHIKDKNNIGWDDNQKDKAGATAHWGTQKSWDFFKYNYGRYGVDGNGLAVNVRITGVTGSDLASNAVKLGFSYENKKWYVALDVVGHEYGHSQARYITEWYTTDNDKEAKALSEGIADIFGISIQYFVEQNNSDWKVGEYCMADKVRHFDNPSSDVYYPSASYYNDSYWQDAQGTWKPYIRSGVLRKWYYLVSQGGLYRGITVSSLGRNNATLICYQALFYLSGENITFIDMKNATIIAAATYFGQCSNEVKQVLKAWEAVNIESIFNFNDNYSVDCNVLNSYHQKDLSFFSSAIENLHSNCTIENNKKTYFTAGNEIRLTNGFRSGTGYFTFFHAYIASCTLNTKAMVEAKDDDENINTYIILYENGQSENGYPNVTIFPNPFDECIYLSNILSDSYKYEVIDINTKIVKEGYVTQLLCFKEIPSGIYLLKIYSNNNCETYKIIKR